MSNTAGAAHDARRRRALPLPVIGSVAAILAIAAAAAFLFLHFDSPEQEGDSSVASAQALYEEGDYAGAEAALSAVVADDAEDIEARKALALALAAQGKNDEAIAQYEAIIEANPKDHESLYLLGGLEQLTGKANESIAHFEAAAELDAEPRYLQALAAVYSTVGRWGDCIETWERYLQTADLDSVSQGTVYAAIAGAYENAREYDKAKAALEQALALDPNNEHYKARLEGYEG